MTSEIPSKPTKICPTCGTRVSIDATRCLVCGSTLESGPTPGRPDKKIQGSRMPQITLNLPIALGLLVIFIAIGAGAVYFALRETEPAIVPTATPTITATSTPTITPTPATPTPTDTPLPTPTPQTYLVQTGDTCAAIAGIFKVSIQSIVLLNNLSADCYVNAGDKLLIPQPTPTATALPSATLSPEEATQQACGVETYIVKENDTLSSIANSFNIPMSVIQEYNGLTSETVFTGKPLIIPLCKQFPTPGPSPTATLPPPYSAANLLLPPDGARFVQPGDVVTLQWAAVGSLLSNEAYEVNIMDFTDGGNRQLIEYVPDTKFTVPMTFQTTDSIPHMYRWWITVVRQNGTDEDGNPVWEPAGTVSTPRVFLWSGAAAAVTPTP